LQATQIFGRTVPGTQEILAKSGRLTQSERLVLIVLGDQIDFAELLHKLPALSPLRIETALSRLLQLELAYEVMVPAVQEDPGGTLNPHAVEAFLQQGSSDPVTVMASPADLEISQKMIAIAQEEGAIPMAAESGKSASRANANPVAVPLTKLFPTDTQSIPVSTVADTVGLEREANSRIEADRLQQRDRIKGMEADIARKIGRANLGVQRERTSAESVATSDRHGRSEAEADKLRRMATRRRFEPELNDKPGLGIWVSAGVAIAAVGALIFWLR
jgi:hypothetical protein